MRNKIVRVDYGSNHYRDQEDELLQELNCGFRIIEAIPVARSVAVGKTHVGGHTADGFIIFILST